MQDGVLVYDKTLMVSDALGQGGSKFVFPPYDTKILGVVGDITWTVTIADDDPDLDEATATTSVK
jgi:hypothetical protein